MAPLCASRPAARTACSTAPADSTYDLGAVPNPDCVTLLLARDVKLTHSPSSPMTRAVTSTVPGAGGTAPPVSPASAWPLDQRNGSVDGRALRRNDSTPEAILAAVGASSGQRTRSRWPTESTHSRMPPATSSWTPTSTDRPSATTGSPHASRCSVGPHCALSRTRSRTKDMASRPLPPVASVEAAAPRASASPTSPSSPAARPSSAASADEPVLTLPGTWAEAGPWPTSTAATCCECER